MNEFIARMLSFPNRLHPFEAALWLVGRVLSFGAPLSDLNGGCSGPADSGTAQQRQGQVECMEWR
jgi:hypothetical protein